MTLEERWQAQLDALRRQGRHRELHPPRGIDFSSNDYLGYGQLFWQSLGGLSRSGQASRLLRGHHQIWEEVENRLAAWHGSEAALMMNSGYVANEGLLSTVVEPGDWVASDELNHASIIDGLRLTKAERFVFRHNDGVHLRESLGDAFKANPDRHHFVVTESYFGMEADSGCGLDLFEIPGGLEVPGAPRFHAIIDEAHATGCFGPQGSGLVDAHGLRKQEWFLASVHTGGKALGVPGAYICCSKLLREWLINRCRHLIFTTALPPALGQWWLDAIDRAQKDSSAREALHENATIFRGALGKHGVQAGGRDYIVPIILGEDATAVGAAEALQKQGFDVRAIRPPTVPPGTARLRLSIHADHDRPTLLGLADAIARLVKAC